MAAQLGPLGPALTRWNDYVGTAAADESEPGRATYSLYEGTGLDPAAWIILSADLNTSGTTTTLTVYAFDRTARGVTSHTDLLELGEQRGELPVTAFEVRGGDVHALALAAFERLAVRLVARGFHDQHLAVEDTRTLDHLARQRPSPAG